MGLDGFGDHFGERVWYSSPWCCVESVRLVGLLLMIRDISLYIVCGNSKEREKRLDIAGLR